MTLKSSSGILIFICLQFTFFTDIYSQLSFNANSEFGYYKNTGNGIFKKNDLVTRINIKGKYEYEIEENYFAASLGIKPELYGVKNNLSGIKIDGKGSYYNNSEMTNWGVNFSIQKNILNSSELDINTDLIFITSDFYFGADEKFPFHLTAGYAYQSYDYSSRKNFDIIFLDSRYEDLLVEDINFFSGLYLERFLISNKTNYFAANLLDKNKGWRIGPQIGINYLQSFLVRCEYRILCHSSDITKATSYEQNYKLLTGVNLSEDFSLFILLDFYLKNLKLTKDFARVREIIYSPMNSENRFYVKLLYDLSENFGTYARYGYGKEILDYYDSYLEGWNLVLGLEINY
jgi:hypothetical protein